MVVQLRSWLDVVQIHRGDLGRVALIYPWTDKYRSAWLVVGVCRGSPGSSGGGSGSGRGGTGGPLL